jgi:hypothetical protein
MRSPAVAKHVISGRRWATDRADPVSQKFAATGHGILAACAERR